MNIETCTRQTQYEPIRIRPHSVSLVYKVSVIRGYDSKVEIGTGFRRRIIPPRVSFANCARLWKASSYFRHITLPDNMSIFVTNISAGMVMGCSDGYFKLELSLGTSESTCPLQSMRRVNAAQGVHQTTGNVGSSHREECQGKYSLLLFLRILCDMYDGLKGSVSLVCDNNNAVNGMREKRGEVSTRRKDCNITRASLRLLAEISIGITFVEVAGYKDRNANYDSISSMEHLNMDCVQLADRLLREVVRFEVKPPLFLPTEDL